MVPARVFTKASGDKIPNNIDVKRVSSLSVLDALFAFWLLVLGQEIPLSKNQGCSIVRFKIFDFAHDYSVITALMVRR